MVGSIDMVYMAENYRLYVGIFTGVIFLVYLILSIFIGVYARKKGLRVVQGAFIPVYNLVVFLMAGLSKDNKNSTDLEEDSEIHL